MLGYTVEEWLDTPDFWSKIVHPDDRHEAVAAAAEIYANEDAGRQEFRYITKDGRVVSVESTYVVIRNNEGHSRHIPLRFNFLQRFPTSLLRQS